MASTRQLVPMDPEANTEPLPEPGKRREYTSLLSFKKTRSPSGAVSRKESRAQQIKEDMFKGTGHKSKFNPRNTPYERHETTQPNHTGGYRKKTVKRTKRRTNKRRTTKRRSTRK